MEKQFSALFPIPPIPTSLIYACYGLISLHVNSHDNRTKWTVFSNTKIFRWGEKEKEPNFLTLYHFGFTVFGLTFWLTESVESFGILAHNEIKLLIVSVTISLETMNTPGTALHVWIWLGPVFFNRETLRFKKLSVRYLSAYVYVFFGLSVISWIFLLNIVFIVDSFCVFVFVRNFYFYYPGFRVISIFDFSSAKNFSA